MNFPSVYQMIPVPEVVYSDTLMPFLQEEMVTEFFKLLYTSSKGEQTWE